MSFTLYGRALASRFLLGTAGYPSPEVLRQSLHASGAQVLTVGLKRTLAAAGDNGFVAAIRETLKATGGHLLPNTAGCRTAREAVTLAQMARELYDTPWIKLEVVGDEHTLQPDPWELVTAAEQLAKDGFHVFPYCTDDLVTCRRLLDAGCEVLMPWGAPIGSAHAARAPARRAADRGRWHRRAVPRRPGDGAGLRRRAAQLRCRASR
jgi:thiazole synthase